jgi:hypothetical protein
VTAPEPPEDKLLTAAGGWCAPSEIEWYLTPTGVALPEVTVRRGGIRYPTPDPDARPPRPPSRWQRAKWRARNRRMRVLHRVAVWIDPYQSRDDDWDDE